MFAKYPRTARPGATRIPRRRAFSLACCVAVAACSDRGVERNPAWRPPVVTETGGVRVVHNVAAREIWRPKRGLPDRPQMLFAGVIPAARDASGMQAMLTPRGDRLLLFDAAGRLRHAVGEEALVRAVGVAPVRDGWAVVETEGDVLLVDSLGAARRLFGTPFGAATVAAFGGGLVAARSPFAVAIEPEPPGAPLLVTLTREGDSTGTIDTTRTVLQPETAGIANAGHVAAGDSLLFFAFLARDEIRAYGRDGRPRWNADRSLPLGVRPPSLDSALRYTAVNLGAAARGRFLYVLSYADTLARTRRLDAFDAATGTLERTVTMPADSVILALDERGALWIAPARSITAGLPAPKLATMPPFTLPTFAGDSVSLAALRGRVVLLNFWASWCAPCRAEFPMMNRLHREYAAKGLSIVAVNEDASEPAARRFVSEMGPLFTIAKGGGRLHGVVAYRGLPFTLLLDRDGRIVSRFFGFGGRDQYRLLAREIERIIGTRHSAVTGRVPSG